MAPPSQVKGCPPNRVNSTAGKALDQPELSIGGAQQHRTGLRGHPPAVERRHHRPPFNWCKAKQIRATLCLHRESPASETNRSRNTIFSDPGPRCTYPFEQERANLTSVVTPAGYWLLLVTALVEAGQLERAEQTLNDNR